jgi:predicted RNase H-like nuclease (RuvC/YqgF family)
MTKEVTKSDVDTVAAAAEAVQPLYQKLLTIQIILREIGNLEQRYRDVQRSIDNLEATLAEDTRQWEAKRAEFAREQKAREDQIFKLDILLKDQRQEVAMLNDIIKHHRATVAA